MENSGVKHRVVILGAGFAGLYAARSLRRAPVDVTIVDPSNHHLFQPLLYQVATGALSPGDIASPVRAILRRQRNVAVLKERAVDLNPERKEVVLEHGSLPYDTLIVAVGLQNHYFGHDWRSVAPGLKSLSDAVEIRRRLLDAFEKAEREPDPKKRDALLTAVIVGAGPTGVEMAGAVAELARDTLRSDFRKVDPRNFRIMLIEAGDRILTAFDPRLSARAQRDLERMGVQVETSTLVKQMGSGEITLERGDSDSTVAAETAVWCAGIRAAAFGEIITRRLGAKADKWGRLVVEPDLSLPGHSEVLIAGDLASVQRERGPVPMVAPAAIQQGKYVAKLLERRLKGRMVKPFSYFDKGNLAVIGRNRAVVEVAGMRFGGFFAWLIWIMIHILFLIEFDNKILVMIQWGFTYFTKKRGARLILE